MSSVSQPERGHADLHKMPDGGWHEPGGLMYFAQGSISLQGVIQPAGFTVDVVRHPGCMTSRDKTSPSPETTSGRGTPPRPIHSSSKRRPAAPSARIRIASGTSAAPPVLTARSIRPSGSAFRISVETACRPGTKSIPPTGKPRPSHSWRTRRPGPDLAGLSARRPPRGGTRARLVAPAPEAVSADRGLYLQRRSGPARLPRLPIQGIA